jgi:hypothetical protein
MNFLPKNKRLRFLLYAAFAFFATVGFVLTGAFLAVKLHLTDDPGAVDFNDRYFQELAVKDYSYIKRNARKKADSLYLATQRKAYIYYKIMTLNEYYPVNASLLLNAINKTEDPVLLEKMFDALIMKTDSNQQLKKKMQFAVKVLERQRPKNQYQQNIFEWMNIPEWTDFKIAVAKDKQQIDSAASILGLEPRLIVSVLVGEQIRLFTSIREVYKEVIAPLKILSVENKFAYGVTGIKEETAIRAEQLLKDKSSDFYLGEKYEHLLDFTTADLANERFQRLIDYRNHFYSYLYAGIIMKQHIAQWKKEGYDISDRPEILATLFNLGYYASKPKANPSVGGANINIKGSVYTFGSLAYEFYYSGELVEPFPYSVRISEKKK